MKHNKKKFIKGIFITIVLLSGAFVIFDSYTRDWDALTVHAEPIVKEILVDNLSKKIEELKWEVVDGIEACESAGHKEDDGIIIFDSNNEASIGQLQFQRKTVVHYYQKFYGQTISKRDAVMIALDLEKARALTYDVIFKEKDGWKNWFNCGKKSAVETKLAMIAKLEQ